MPVASSRPQSDAQWCVRLAFRRAHTFAAASAWLPPEKRRGAFAVYAFCRSADDIVDTSPAAHPTPARERLARYAHAVREALAGRASAPALRELAWAVERFAIPVLAIEELLAGLERDLAPVTYQTWDDLAGYGAGVASSVGEMCTAVFGVRGGSATYRTAVTHARTLGLAMQLTNILRDVGEDAERGRCYLPVEDLARVGFTPADVLTGNVLRHRDQWRTLMQDEVARARALYASAAPGIALLDADAQRCAQACSVGYEAILDALEHLDYDSIRHRAVVPRTALLRVLAQATAAPAR